MVLTALRSMRASERFFAYKGWTTHLSRISLLSAESCIYIPNGFFNCSPSHTSSFHLYRLTRNAHLNYRNANIPTSWRVRSRVWMSPINGKFYTAMVGTTAKQKHEDRARFGQPRTTFSRYRHSCTATWQHHWSTRPHHQSCRQLSNPPLSKYASSKDSTCEHPIPFHASVR